MRSQLGADAVDIDTRESTCSFAFEAPTPLDFTVVESAAADANYVLTGITLHAIGNVLQGACMTCDKDALFFELPGTKQRFELDGALPLGMGQVSLRTTDWQADHLRMGVVGE